MKYISGMMEGKKRIMKCDSKKKVESKVGINNLINY